MFRDKKRRYIFAVVAAVVGALAGGAQVLDYIGIRPDAPAKAEPIRVTFYRLGGATGDLLVQGLLAREWREALGGPQAIMSNEVLDSARRVMQRFREPLIGDLLLPSAETSIPLSARRLGQYASSIEPRRTVTASSSDWQAFLGGQPYPRFFVPDVNAIEKYIDSDAIPAGYSTYHVKASGKTTPIIWRWMQPDDLTGYEDRLREFKSRFLGRDQTYLGINMIYATPTAISGLRWLTERGLPAEFVLMVGYPTGHGGWTIEASMRHFELEVAVIENVSDKPIPITSLTYRSWGDNTLRTRMETDGALPAADVGKRPLLAAKTMAPREKIIVPTRVSFAYPPRSVEPPYGLTEPEYPLAADNPNMREVWVANVRGRDRIVRKRTDQITRSALPPIVERFDFGPSWLLESILVNDVNTPVRRPDWANLTLHFGHESGSCPFVYTRHAPKGPWISEGHILLGATRIDLERTEVKPLTRFDGGLVLREIEDEVAFIRSVRLIVDTEHGEQVYMSPMQQPDRYWIIQPGEQIELNFPAFDAIRHSNPRVEVTGYYRPYSFHRLDD